MPSRQKPVAPEPDQKTQELPNFPAIQQEQVGAKTPPARLRRIPRNFSRSDDGSRSNDT